MGDLQTQTRVHIEIDGRDFVLGGDRDLVNVMSQIEAAAASPPAFVDLSDGHQMVSVLILPTTRVVVTVENAFPVAAEAFPPVTIPDWDL